MSISYKDYYAILGVSKTATKQEITKAFKTLARKYHPDMNKGDKGAEDKFKEINEAYEVLKDDEKRRHYDALGSNWQAGAQFNHAGGGASHFSDFFDAIFGGSGFKQSGGFNNFSGPFGGMGGFDGFSMPENLDKNLEIEVTLEDIAQGAKKTISLRDGHSGAIKNLEVSIPQGIENQGVIRLRNQGNTGRKGNKGDLYITIVYKKHHLFAVEGSNILYTLHVAPWVPILGDVVQVPTLYGSIELTIPRGTKAGAKMRVQGKGLGKENAKGAMYVTIQPDNIPHDITENQEKAWEALREAYRK